MALVTLRKVSKAFPGVQALDRVDLEVQAGEVHALIGENGAGKSTLIKLLSGVYQRDSGTIEFDGRKVTFASPQEAQRLGIRTLYQEPSLLPQLTVAENIALGSEPRWRWMPFINWRELRRQAREALALLDLHINPDLRVVRLGYAEQQMVELAKILHMQAKLLIMDEPTAALSRREVETLFGLIRAIKARQIGVLYVSHRLDEVLEIADRITVLRDGRRIVTLNAADSTFDQLVRLMSGDPLLHSFERRQVHQSGAEVLRAEGLTRQPDYTDVSFALHAGEIFGLTGPMGCGLTALARALFGFQPAHSGALYVEGRPVSIRAPHEAIALGIGFLPEDRHEQALLLDMTAPENISLTAMAQAGPLEMLDRRAELEQAEEYIQRLHIKLPGLETRVRDLSGGTQQKIILSRWLAVHSRILIFEEPTRGIDINARFEIYRLLHDLARRGVAILIISSDLSEIVRLCDRALVMREGRTVATLEGDEISLEALAHHVVG